MPNFTHSKDRTGASKFKNRSRDSQGITARYWGGGGRYFVMFGLPFTWLSHQTQLPKKPEVFIFTRTDDSEGDGKI